MNPSEVAGAHHLPWIRVVSSIAKWLMLLRCVEFIVHLLDHVKYIVNLLQRWLATHRSGAHPGSHALCEIFVTPS